MESVKDIFENEAEIRYPVLRHVDPENSPYKLSNAAFKYGCSFGYSQNNLAVEYPLLEARCQRLENEYKSLQDKNKQLLEALKPFADMFGELTEEKVRQGGKVYEYNKAFFTVADLFAAYNALNPIK